MTVINASAAAALLEQRPEKSYRSRSIVHFACLELVFSGTPFKIGQNQSPESGKRKKVNT